MENLVTLGKGLRLSSAVRTETGNEESRNRKRPIPVSNFQEFGVTKAMDQEFRLLLISRSEGEALEVTRGTELESVRSGTMPKTSCSRQILSPQRVTKLDDLSHFIQAWENFELKHWNALETNYPKTGDLPFVYTS